MKITAILSGGDWVDASVEHLIITCEKPIEQLNKEYKEWYKNDFEPNRDTVRYQSLKEWLVDNDFARKPEENELEEFWEDT